jgi:hypothetical protein
MAVDNALKQHDRAVRARFRQKYADEDARWKIRDRFMMAITLLSALTAFVCILLVLRYASTITVINTTRETDRFGQVIGEHARVMRLPADTAANSLMFTLVNDAFPVFNDPVALSTNYAEAESLFDASSEDAKTNLRAYWVKYSPLNADGTMRSQHVTEEDAKKVSLLYRGPALHGAREYQLEWSVTPHGENPVTTFFQADVILTPGGPVTDLDPEGLYITHFTWNEMK